MWVVLARHNILSLKIQPHQSFFTLFELKHVFYINVIIKKLKI